jgi:hypothetical protein
MGMVASGVICYVAVFFILETLVSPHVRRRALFPDVV